jgi:hypothetical protein
MQSTTQIQKQLRMCPLYIENEPHSLLEDTSQDKDCQIERIFEDIIQRINDPQFANVFLLEGRALSSSIQEFKLYLKTELNHKTKVDPVKMAEKLRETINTILCFNNTDAITQFDKFVRHSRLSERAFKILDAIIGGVATAAVLIGAMSLASGFPPAAPFLAFTGIMTLAGSCDGWRIGHFVYNSKVNDAHLGNVLSHLKSFAHAKESLFSQNNEKMKDTPIPCLNKPPCRSRGY